MVDPARRAADTVRVNDRSGLALPLGVLGLVAGVLCVASGLTVLGLVAGALALTAAGLSRRTPAASSTPTGPATAAAPPGPVASAPPSAGGFAPPSVPAHGPGWAGEPRRKTDTPPSTPVAPAPVSATPLPTPGPAPEPEPAVAASVSPGAPEDSVDEPGFVDHETGLFNDAYFRVAVETRVLAARRHLRPVAVVLFGVVEEGDDGDWATASPGPVADAIRDTLREADTACRLADGRFGFVLEDTPEDGAIWTVERVRRALSATEGLQTRWAGIACYPAHAFSADEAMEKAERAYELAKEWAQDRIEVALPD